MNHLEKSLEAFFSGEAKVAVIKGEWGVGKTYFWENYISKRIESGDLPQIAYSYISLFGSSSLNDIRKRVFHNAKAITSDDRVDEVFEHEFNESSSLFNKLPWVKEGLSKAQSKSPLINWFSKNSQNIPVIGNFSGIISSLEYSLVKNYIVCIDDMERKGKGLTVKEIMGLVDELAQRKSCKIVLIFNENSFDNEEDSSQFESYREKVVDIEINHNPTSKENLACIFDRNFERYSILEDVIGELGIKNIRVIRKLKWIFERFHAYIRGKDSQIIDEFIVHSALLCWSYYIRDEDLSYELLKDQLSSNSWMSFLMDKDKEITLGEKKYRALASSMKLESSVFDPHITFFLENGYFEEEKLLKTVSELEEKIRVDSVSARLRSVWDIYSESFSDNLDEFKRALIDILNEEMPRLGLSEFSSAVDILEEFDEDISHFVDNYIQLHAESLAKLDSWHSWDMGRFKCSLLKEKIEELHKSSKNHNLDDVSLKIAVDKGWNPEDLDFLCSLSKDDYVSWMKSNPDDLVTKVRGGLLTFRNLQSSGNDQDKYSKISENTVAALKEIASENEFNKRRIQLIYEVE